MKKTYFYLAISLNLFGAMNILAADAPYELPPAELEYLRALHSMAIIDICNKDLARFVVRENCPSAFDERNLKEALQHFANAKKLGHDVANQILTRYNIDQKISVDPDERLRILHREANLGSPYSLYTLAQAYHEGLGIDKDIDEALRLYKLSAAQGYCPAECALARKYERGKDVLRDLGEALRLYKLSADRGYGYAQYALAKKYHGGEGVPRDLDEALRLYKLAFDQGILWAEKKICSLLK